MKIPNHIAIILDGKRKMGKKQRNAQELRPCEGLRQPEYICEVAKELGVKYLTVYAFPQKTGSGPGKRWKA